MGDIRDKLRASAKSGYALGSDKGTILVDREAPEGLGVEWGDKGGRYVSQEPEPKLRATTQSSGASADAGMGGSNPKAGAPEDQKMRYEDLDKWAAAETAKTRGATAAIRPEDATVKDPLDKSQRSASEADVLKTPAWLEAYMRNR